MTPSFMMMENKNDQVLIVQTHFNGFRSRPISIESDSILYSLFKLNVVSSVSINENLIGGGLYISLKKGRIDVDKSCFTTITSIYSSFCFQTTSTFSKSIMCQCSLSSGSHAAHQLIKLIRDMNMTHLSSNGQCTGIVHSRDLKYIICDSLSGNSAHRSSGNCIYNFFFIGCSTNYIFDPNPGEIAMKDSIIKNCGKAIITTNDSKAALSYCILIGGPYKYERASTVDCDITASSHVFWITRTYVCYGSKKTKNMMFIVGTMLIFKLINE